MQEDEQKYLLDDPEDHDGILDDPIEQIFGTGG